MNRFIWSLKIFTPTIKTNLIIPDATQWIRVFIIKKGFGELNSIRKHKCVHEWHILRNIIINSSLFIKNLLLKISLCSCRKVHDYRKKRILIFNLYLYKFPKKRKKKILISTLLMKYYSTFINRKLLSHHITKSDKKKGVHLIIRDFKLI